MGHATLFTGADPSIHGLVGNNWIDTKTADLVYNTEDDRHHIIGKAPKLHNGVSLRNLLASTIGDELVLANAGKSRVFSVSVKDRGAIIPGGHAGKAFWYSKSSGKFVSSSYYYDEYPKWVSQWNAAKPADQYRGKRGSCYRSPPATSQKIWTIDHMKRISYRWVEHFLINMVTTNIFI